MATKTITTLARCIKLCRKHLCGAETQMEILEISGEEMGFGTRNTLLLVIEQIEQSCERIRDYIRRCSTF